MICPLHEPVLKENLGHYLEKYKIWSSYSVESDGVMTAYTSIYGNTKRAAEVLAYKLREKGCPDVVLCDLAREDMSKAVANAFRYGKLVLATTTYNAEIFPFMRDFIEHLTERNYQNRTISRLKMEKLGTSGCKSDGKECSKSAEISHGWMGRLTSCPPSVKKIWNS